MRSALYYPHTEIQDEALIRSALLTWDRLEFIVPWRGFKPDYRRRDMAEAMELIGCPVVPTDDDRREVHDQLEELIARGVPEPFLYRDQRHRRREVDYEMWPQKLMPETWRLLREHDVIGGVLDNDDYPASQGGGLTIMAMLADVMAGETRARVTDRGLAYASIANVAKPARKRRPAGDVAQIVPLTFKSLAMEHVDLETLIAFRQREARGNGNDYRTLRRTYLDRLSKHLTEAAKHAVGSRDREELDRVFEQDMEDDLRDLKAELGMARGDAIMSKDTIAFVFGAVAAGTAVAASAPMPEVFTAAGGAAAIGGIVSVANKFGAKRREVLRKHPIVFRLAKLTPFSGR